MHKLHFIKKRTCLLLYRFQCIFINGSIGRREGGDVPSVSVCQYFLFLSLFIVRGGGFSGIQRGTCVGAQLQPDGSQPPAPSLCVRRPGPCCCPLGQPSGLHTGKTEHYIWLFLFMIESFFAGQLSDCRIHHQIKTKRTNDTPAMLMHTQQNWETALDLPNKVMLL